MFLSIFRTIREPVPVLPGVLHVEVMAVNSVFPKVTGSGVLPDCDVVHRSTASDSMMLPRARVFEMGPKFECESLSRKPPRHSEHWLLKQKSETPGAFRYKATVIGREPVGLLLSCQARSLFKKFTVDAQSDKQVRRRPVLSTVFIAVSINKLVDNLCCRRLI